MAEESEVKNALNIRDFSKVILTLENCLVPIDKISPTPSENDGIEREVEVDLRILGCELIQTSGILLKLPQVAMAAAQVLFQRFYYSKSLVKHNMEVVAMACVNLASKIEEAPRRIRDVVNVFHHIKQVKAGKTIQPLVLDTNYVNLKNQVIKAERRILKELGFCVHVKHPHKIIVMYLQVLECERNQRLVQYAWNYMNDSFRTNVFVRYSPETIACACIFLAARKLQFCLPSNPPWFALFDAREDDLKDISLEILRLYSRKKPNTERLEQVVNEIKKQQIEARLRARGLQTSDTSRPNTPSKVDNSPLSTVKKLKAEDARSEVSFGHNMPKKRSRTRSPDSRDSRSRSPPSKSRSYSRSKSRSPSRKRFRTPPRKHKDHKSDRNRDRRHKDDVKVKDKGYERDYSKIADNYYKKKDKRYKEQDYYNNDVRDAYNDYYDVREYKPRKQQQQPPPEARVRSVSYSPPPEQYAKNKKKYYKEKRRTRSRSRSPYERHEVKRAKAKKHANGHRRSSRTPERYRR